MNVSTSSGQDARGHVPYQRGMASVGERVRTKREELKISQEKLAREIGVSKNTVGRWEAGGGIDGENLDRLALALGVSSDWILRGDRREETTTVTPDPAHWPEFIERYGHLAELTETQLNEIKNFAARTGMRVRSWTDFERIAEIVRTSSESPTFEGKRRKRG
jgi:transcriptional regulator with XRE-family HTH domain